LAGEPVVACYLAGERARLASAGATRKRRGGAAVQEALAGQAGLFVDQGTEFVVVEVVGQGTSNGADLPNETARDQLFQGIQRLFLASTARRPDGVEVERSPDDGGGDYLPRRLADRSEAGLEEILHPSRQRPGVIP
jgi:hypothetical protein